MRKFLTKNFWNIEVWAVQKPVNLADLAKSFPTSIYLQNLTSMQPRTSPVKFARSLAVQQPSRVLGRRSQVAAADSSSRPWAWWSAAAGASSPLSGERSGVSPQPTAVALHIRRVLPPEGFRAYIFSNIFPQNLQQISEVESKYDKICFDFPLKIW